MILDTCALIWILNDSPRMIAVKPILDRAESVTVSSISLAEMAIKRQIGKLELPELWNEAIEGIPVVPFTDRDAYILDTLPMFHRDPFDRMIIAQAIRLSSPIVTADKSFLEYPVEIIRI